MRFGILEGLIFLVVVLLIFGPKKLPGIGHALGNGIREFRKAAKKDDQSSADTKE